MASPQKRLPLVVVLAPLVAVLAVAGVVGFNMYRDYQRSEAEEEDAKRQLALAQEQKLSNAKARVEAQPPPAPVETDEDELGALPGQKKKPKPPPVNQSPAQRAYFGFKSAYEKLEGANENAARKFRARKLQLDDQFSGGKPANEAKFVAECDAARTQIVELLRNPENR